MPTTEIDCLIALARERDYGQAAARCEVSEAELRASIDGLAQSFGHAIVTSGERFDGFTDAGERVLEWARATHAKTELLKDDLRVARQRRAMAPLLARRSVSPKRLMGPAPGREELASMLQAALSAPDHGGLRPWRVIEFGAGEREVLAALFEQEKRRRDPLAPASDLARAREHATRAPALLAFVLSPDLRSHVPRREQYLSAGAALGNLLNAAHQLGYGAIMLSGDRCYDPLLQGQLGLAPDEMLAGFISLGTVRQPPPARPRPDTAPVWSTWQPHGALRALETTGSADEADSPG